MKRTTIFFSTLIVAVLTFASCGDGISPSKNKITKKYSVDAFNKIESYGATNIVFAQGNATTVEANGSDNVIPHLIVTCKDSTLRISMEEGFKFRNLKGSSAKITITSPALCSILQKGTGNVILKDSIKVDNLVITSNGAGNFSADALTANNMKVSLHGVGNITLKGTADVASYQVHGIGNLNAKGMIVSDVVVEQNGIGNVSCYASEKITIKTNGIGNVDYYGNPEVTDIKKSGIGSIKRR